ncbi:MAG: extracellular solute-binding protein [Firmicutes bacterium]|jgi:multiple sugar transport system substrate-binding protein|nr:extracellular solute-binding protein [Bacillota bacterium]
MGLLRDLTELWESSAVVRRARLYPFMPDVAKFEGRVYGVPFDFNSQIWYVNLDYLAESGVVPPGENWTVEDLRTLARKLTDPIKRVYATTNEVVRGDTQNLQWIQIWTGYDWLSDDRQEVLVDSPGNLEMLAFWDDLQNNLNATPGWPGAWSAKGNYYQGGVALWMGWPTYSVSVSHMVNHDWAFALMPKAPAGQLSFAQGHMFSIPANAAHPEAAWRLAEWMMSYEGQKAVRHRTPNCGPSFSRVWVRMRAATPETGS